MTVEMKTNFLTSTAADLLCTATVHRRGRQLAFGTAETHDIAGRYVAHSTLTYARS